jgi:hypothetical protein
VQFTVPVANNNGTSFTFVVGTQTTYPNGVPPGIYSVAGQIVDPNSTPVLIQQTTNALVLALAPTLPATQAATLQADPDSATTVLVTIAGFTPNPWAGQTVALTLSSLTAPPPAGPAVLRDLDHYSSAPAEQCGGCSGDHYQVCGDGQRGDPDGGEYLYRGHGSAVRGVECSDVSEWTDAGRAGLGTEQQ